MITTPLCALLGIAHPILNAAMAGTATGALAAAVSDAGGFGMIGGTNPAGAPWLREQIRIARSRTSRPFGVGFISSFPDTEELVRVALEERTEIPFRALMPSGLDGILIGGKAYSTTHDGLAGPRMMPDLENQGGVVGLAASLAIRGGGTPRGIDVRALQRRLVEVGVLPEEVLARQLTPRHYSDADLGALVADLKSEAERPLYAYGDMKLTDRYDELITFVEVCTAGPRNVPALESALATAEGPYRVRIAQALAMYGAETATPILVSEIERHLADGSLPIRDAGIRYMGWLPDQGAMPDVCFLLYSLGQTREHPSLHIWRKVVDLLNPTEEDFGDRTKGIFYYVDAVCYGAERLGDPLAIPVLEKLHSYAPLRDQVTRDGFQADIFAERRAMLELAIGRALARCGSARGYEILIGYLDDNRALLAEGAHAELIALTRHDDGKDRQAWSRWLATARESLQPCPYQGRLDMPGEDEEILRPVTVIADGTDLVDRQVPHAG
jgi:hypothetical protein